VHVQEFPAPNESKKDKAVEGLVDELLKLRGVIGQAVERARQEKLIGNALEARVVLRCDAKKLAGISREELEEFFILSDLQLEQAEEASASISKTPYQKCARCWRHRPTVGASAEHPDLCDRCEAVVTQAISPAK
ncbi:MAG: zinc finger domain-containing protein, partial [Chthoniobacterales bacterium]